MKNRKATMRRWVEEFPEEGLPWFWIPDRVPGCRHAACRRARRCVRPRMVERRPAPHFPSCPLVTHEEWGVWGWTVYPRIRHLLSPADDRVMAARRAHFEASRRGW